MALKIILIGEPSKGYVLSGEQEFLKRIGRFLKIQTILIHPPKKWNQFKPEERKNAEGGKILDLVQATDQLILLDEQGKQYTSVGFAEKLDSLLAFGGGDVVFVIGGAYGFSKAVYQRANQKVSLSKMTFNHHLVRVIFLEQLYRALTILHGHPYHNE